METIPPELETAKSSTLMFVKKGLNISNIVFFKLRSWNIEYLDEMLQITWKEQICTVGQL